MAEPGPEAVRIPTSAGDITLVGRFSAFQEDRPLILAMPGALQSPVRLFPLSVLAPEADHAIALLPGMFAPAIAEMGVGPFAAALDEVVTLRFPRRRVLRLGFSVGGLVALAMRGGQAFVAVDSPLTTGTLWQLVRPLRAELARGQNPALPDWAWTILGISKDRVENRDYRPLLSQLNVPGVFVVAEDPLEPPRPLQRPPGALGLEDRELISRTPGVATILAVGSGHDVMGDAPLTLQRALETGLGLLPR